MLIKRNHKHIRRLLIYFVWPCIKAILSRMSVLTSPGIKWISKLHYGYIKTDMNCPYNNNDWGRNTYTRLNVGQQTKLTKRLHPESTISEENITADLITTSCSYSVKTHGNSTPLYLAALFSQWKEPAYWPMFLYVFQFLRYFRWNFSCSASVQCNIPWNPYIVTQKEIKYASVFSLLSYVFTIA